jgi:hypothetical protein
MTECILLLLLLLLFVFFLPSFYSSLSFYVVAAGAQ